MKKIAVIMQHFKIHGGIETCTYSLIEALNSIGIEPAVYGRVNYLGEEENMKQEIQERFGKRLNFKFNILFCDKFRHHQLIDKIKTDPSIYTALTLIGKRYDFVYDFTLPLPYFTNGGKYFKYWNFLYPNMPFNTYKKIGSFFRSKLYYLPRKFSNEMRKWNFYRDKYKIALNSKYTAALAEEHLKKKIQVIYPPVNLKLFWSTKTNNRNGVITWGRFAEYKRQIDVVKIAKSLLEQGFNIPFRICGGTESFPKYYAKVEGYVRKNDLNNVKLYPNISVYRFKELSEKSLIYLHNMRGEPFGITTAEAIANGCLPIVHNSGGQREIVPLDELRFDDDADAIDRIRSLLKDTTKQDLHRTRLQQYIKQFDERIFQKKLLQYIDS